MFNQLTRPFRYKRIPLTNIKTNKETPQANRKVRPKNWFSTLKRIWSFLSVHKTYLWLVISMVILSSFFSLLGPFLIGMAIDDLLVSYQLNELMKLLIFLLFIYLFYSISTWLQNYWMIGIAQKTVSEMRSQLFKRLQRLPISYLDKKQHGELMSRLTNDIENVSTTLNTSVIQIFSSVLTFIGIIAVMFYLSPLLTVITLLVIPLMVFGMKWITKRTGLFFKEQQKHLGDVNGFIEETISGQRIVKVFSQEQFVINRFRDKSEQLKRASFWAQTYSGFIPKLMNVLNNLSFALIAGIGGVLAFNGVITIGVIVIFTEYSRQFTRPLNDLANQFNMLLSAIAGAERVFDILDEEEEKDQEYASSLQEVAGDVEFQQVSFSYENNENTIKNVSFSVEAGETVALVGPTGAGKTTIINLLSRFYDASSGVITIDDQDIMNLKRDSLRQHIGFVLQDSILFKGTIRENIRYGKLDATDQEVEEAAKQANAISFINRLPNKFDTVLEQDHTGISQGQKQLLSIARVILANPAILILDEATSSIDTITEIKIQEALERLMKGRTSFVIAHRLNTVRKANQILVLKEGRLIERGSHEDLVKQKGFYYEMVEHSNG
ncbi:ABC transporter ATP-binding protein [Halalkalibacter akibai]|uniref:Lipid A export ATP-binding/permease protein MsbA n=1 Tax=Halalkalibacter akibai (strain ATCC 43226 / DSM 21942 / CIP 109018 / JCM 9157 / 1139) TaxID=1236973 RepID=W4R0C9_HALA3|nr:ABC transporter ATP-binding protein [Halalkalibacter akibai]GAE37004.1 lipid A export ATP-binding/permease protein MsbA [Halalkalibacter akibai JCM 9157]